MDHLPVPTVLEFLQPAVQEIMASRMSVYIGGPIGYLGPATSESRSE
ncbi:hypothetical protein I4I84_14730 [Pseudonocardia sp. KRD-182]|nr:hypothetical protein [Pseudonocardia oceani]MBW0109978.1 hypothetical protein [Pseudonocardia oceani]